VSDSPDSVSLYVHVPFCASKCDYCDFESRAVDPFARNAFTGYRTSAMREVRDREVQGLLANVPTAYVGGGTPTLLGDELPALVRDLRSLVGVATDAEVSVEANPDSLDGRLVAALFDAGVTRVSLGVQSLDDEVLRRLGRRHDAASALRAASVLAHSGLRFSLDLICGVPGQTTASWKATVAGAVATGAGHVSVYPLIVEEGTALGARIDAGHEPDTDPDIAAEQMTVAARILTEAGMARYEVASYARPGEECRHNIRYWTGGAYLGVGPSAASMLPTRLAALAGLVAPDDGARVRFTDVGEPEWLTREEALREDAMLGLRLALGIEAGLAVRAGVDAVLADLAASRLVALMSGAGEAARWRPTDKGWLLGNEVFGRVWAGE
jgi:oxygen-independent coproporphyrinogen-3 oxidase